MPVGAAAGGATTCCPVATTSAGAPARLSAQPRTRDRVVVHPVTLDIFASRRDSSPNRIATHILAFTGEDRALGEGIAIEGSGDATGRVFFHPGNYQSWREYYGKLREKAGLPPIEAVGAHRKFSGS